jgi:hypothetical protein
MFKPIKSSEIIDNIGFRLWAYLNPFHVSKPLLMGCVDLGAKVLEAEAGLILHNSLASSYSGDYRTFRAASSLINSKR